MNNEKYAVYERKPSHGSTKNGMILGPFNSKKEAQSAGEKYGYAGNNYYVNSINNERYNQIIDEAYENYVKWVESPENQSNKWELVKIPGSRGDFIKSIKGDDELLKKMSKRYCDEFAKTWGLKIEERELSLEEKEWQLEKTNCINDIENDRILYGHEWEKYIQEQYEGIQSNQGIKIPTKLITLTYKNETIENYE